MPRQTYIKLEAGDYIEALYTSGQWQCPSDVSKVDVLLVGGGGRGGYNASNNNRAGGGGGGGGVRYLQNITVTPLQTYNASVGGGGDDSCGDGLSGGDTYFLGYCVPGGGNGGNCDTTGLIGKGWPGGSGGGGGNTNTTSYNFGSVPGAGNSKTECGFCPGNYNPSVGYAGGWGHNDACTGISGGSGGGGGGAGAPGESVGPGLVQSQTTGGNGGDGLYYGDIFGDQFGDEGWFGGGGGGGSRSTSVTNETTTSRKGGKGGGGNGASGGSSPYDTSLYWGAWGMNGAGGGGGGTRYGEQSKGGDGIVLIKYNIPTTSWRKCSNIWLKDSSTWKDWTMSYVKIDSSWNECMGFNDFMDASGGTITTDGDYKIHTFDASGTYTFTVYNGGDASVLMLGGGGSGGTGSSSYAGGGGAAGICVQLNKRITIGDHALVVGNSGKYAYSEVGTSSIFYGIVATGGGAGQAQQGSVSGDGGSNALYSGDNPSGIDSGGGGAGSGSGTTNRFGGAGTTSSISGSSVTYGVGGDGGRYGYPVDVGQNGSDAIIIIRYKYK